VPAVLLTATMVGLDLLGAGCTLLNRDPSSTGSVTPSLSPGVGPSRGSPASPTSAGSPSPTSASDPEPTATPGTARARTIVIDPGHSGRSIRSVDRTGLRDIDYPNYPEIYEMFDVSVCVAESLRADGYRVLLTKRHALSSVSHRQRATVANRAKADLAISVHDDHGVGPRFEATYSQRGVRRSDGTYPEMFRGTGKSRTTFELPAVARRSDQVAHALARARSTTQRRTVSVTENSFNGRAPLERGNLALVQLFSEVPWVYNEM
jgi:N-acetylmuramoyl-L-alanine amidase